MNCWEFVRKFKRIMKNAGPGLAVCLVLCLAAGPASAVEFDVKGTKVNLGGYIKLSANYDIDGTVNDSIPNAWG